MSSPRCLIIEPDPQFAYVLSGIISRHGLDVDIAGDPFAALRQLHLEHFELILYDVTSEDFDHDTVLATLRRDLPGILPRLVIVTTTPLDSSRIPAGVPVIGRSDLRPLLDYINR